MSGAAAAFGRVAAAIAVASLAGASSRTGDVRAAGASAASDVSVSRTVTGNPPRRDIILTRVDGTGVRRLTPSLTQADGRAAWSPDGVHVAFSSSTRGSNGRDVFVVDAGGTTVRRLTRSGRAFEPLWSPDGGTIVFAELEPGSSGPPSAAVWAFDVADGTVHRLTESARGQIDRPASFTRTGAELAFTRTVITEAPSSGEVSISEAVYVLETGSGRVRKLFDRASDPTFAPDGSRIAFVSDRAESGRLSYGDRTSVANELYTATPSGRDVRRLTRTRGLNEARPAWSPDGRVIAYQRGKVTGNAEGTVVLVVRPDGTCPRLVAFDPGLGVWYGDPAWRPGSPSGAALPCRPSRPPQPNLVPLSGNLSLGAARRYRPLEVHWVGRRFDGFILSSMSAMRASGPRGRGPVVYLHYGGFEIQLWHVCARVPADVDLARDDRVRIGGTTAVLFERGTRLELVTGKTTVVVFGHNRAQVVRIARALRPIAASRRSRLAPPAAGALARRLRCPP